MTVRQKIAMAFGTAGLTLLVGAAALALVMRVRTATIAVESTSLLTLRLERLVGAVVDAETGQRGYLLTGDSTYLAPYRSGLSQSDSLLASLRVMVAGNAPQARRLARLDSLIRAKHAELAETIMLRSTRGSTPATALVRHDEGKRLMEETRRVARDMEDESNRALRVHQRQRSLVRLASLVVILGGSLFAFALAYGVNRSIRLDVIESERVQVLLEQQAREMKEQAVELERANEQLRETTTLAEEARDAAERASRAKDEFLAVMSHELRTPLNAIVGYADLVRGGFTGALTEQQRHHLDRIKLSARHLVGLVDEILSLTKRAELATTPRLAEVDVARVTEEAGALVEPVAMQKGLAFSVSTPNERATLFTDAGKLRQTLVNLLANAIKFTPSGSVALASRIDGDRVVFEVRDTGIGIAPEHLERVFEPFWQADQSSTREAGGAGLGLSVSRALARALGGDIAVRSELGKGTVFSLTLPHTPAVSSRPPAALHAV